MDTTRFVTALFEHLLRDGVRICHWKSNLALNDARSGRTDLDVLLQEEGRKGLEAAFAHFGFVEISSPWEKRYPGLEDWLGVDPSSGRCVHMHVHYRLVLGPQNQKCFHLPVEEWVLANLRQIESIPVPQPEVELVLLVLRMHLKLRARKLRQRARRPGREVFPPAITSEFDWLARDVSPAALGTALQALGIGLEQEQVGRFVERFKSGELTSSDIRSMRRDVFKHLEPYRFEARSIGIARDRVSRLFKGKRSFIKFLRPRKKLLLGRGRVLALIGADGTGKSTLTGDLREHFSWKLKVENAYLGLPRTSPSVRSLKWLGNKLTRLGFSRLAAFASALRWISVARVRLRVARRAQRLAARGWLVIADRYPQPEFASMSAPMDGPRIGSENGGHETWLAAWEQSIYDRVPPATDTFVLTAPFNCLHARKPDTEVEIHREKVDAVNALALDRARFTVDVSQPYAEVRLHITREIWRRIAGMKEADFLSLGVDSPSR